MMRTEEVTIAEIFRKNGYRTGQFGKWHLGDTWPFRPQDQGFDEVVGLLCGGIGQISDYWGNDYFDDMYYHNGIPTQYEGYCTDVFFNETMRFIQDSKDEPFMIYLAPNVAHLPNRVEEEYASPYQEMGLEKGQSIYYGMITNFDDNMGRLMKMLEEEGLKENTVVIYTTDDGPQSNGQQFDEGGWPLENGFNAGQRGGKGSSYEGGHRLFSFVRWPDGGLKVGSEIDDLTSVTDILPTVLDLCDIEIPKELDLDGRSFKTGLYGKPLPNNEERSIVISKFNNDEKDTLTGNMCVMYKDWRLNHLGELFNIADDREQRNDIAKDHPEIMELMYEKYSDWLSHTTGDIKVPVRFVLGDKRAPVISLTTQDSYMPKGNSAFSQKHVSELNDKNGPWKVTLAKTGRYKFTLSRYPIYTGLPFNMNVHRDKVNFDAVQAKILVGDKIVQKEIKATDNKVVFELDLKAGDTDLQTWLISSDGMEIPSYFVDVELN
jgi:arylsulfatase A-like enzyme